MKLDTYILEIDRSKYHQKPTLYKNGDLIFEGEQFYKITENTIIFYETDGGQGYGYSAGEIIFIQNIIGANFRRKIIK